MINLLVSFSSVSSRGGNVEHRGRYAQYISLLLRLFIFNPFYCRHLSSFPTLISLAKLSPSAFSLARGKAFYVSTHVGQSEWCFNNRISLNFLGRNRKFHFSSCLQAVPRVSTSPCRKLNVKNVTSRVVFTLRNSLQEYTQRILRISYVYICARVLVREIKIIRDNEIRRGNEESQIKGYKRITELQSGRFLCKRDFPITSSRL